MLAATAPVLAIDTEGNSKDVRRGADPEGKTMGISLAHRPSLFNGEVIVSDYYPFRHKWNNLEPGHLDLMRRVLESYDGQIVMHNAKHDIAALRNLGIEVPTKNLFCTMLGVTWVNEELPSKALDYASKAYGGEPKNRSKEMQRIIDVWGWEYVPPEMMTEYAANDAKITLELRDNIWGTFKAEGYAGPLWERELRWLDLVMRMEARGIGVNNSLCEQQIEVGSKVQAEVLLTLKHNPLSNKDLNKLLIQEMKLPILGYTDTGAPSFAKKYMEEYEQILEGRNDTTAQQILTYRGWNKAISSSYMAYLEKQSPDGFLRCNYKLHGTKQIRLSCEKPNLQQIPQESSKPWNGQMKKAFKARPGFTLWEFDYGQLEMRVAAIYSQDPTLIRAFKSGVSLFKDMHSRMPQWDYNHVKRNSYATLYGAGVDKVALILNISYDNAASMRMDFYNTYPNLRMAASKASNIAKKRGYLNMWTGRRRHFDGVVSTHKAFNSICQGGGAEIVKSAALDIDEQIDWEECSLLLQIHDAFVFEIANGTEDKWIPIIQQTMETPGRYNGAFSQIPFPVDVHKFGEK